MVEVLFFFIYIPIFTRPNCYNLMQQQRKASMMATPLASRSFFTHRVTDQHCHLLFNKPSSVFFEMLIGVFLAHDIGNCYKSNHKSSLCVLFFFFSSLWCRSTRYQHHFVGYTPGTLCIIENVKCEMPFNVYCYISWVCNTHYGNCELLHFTVLTGLLYR